jgi:hypothetical protein
MYLASWHFSTRPREIHAARYVEETKSFDKLLQNSAEEQNHSFVRPVAGCHCNCNSRTAYCILLPGALP